MRIAASLFHMNLQKKDDRNAFFLVAEIFCASIMGAAGAFNAAFAVRLGASNSQIGLLSSIPALLALIVSIPAGRYLQRKAKRKPWLLGSLTLSRVGMLMVALSPFIHMGSSQGLLVVTILVIMSTPASFFNVGFTPMLANVIPEENRATVFAARNVISGGTTSVAVFLFGQWLSRMTFPINYQIMFFVGWATSLLSIYFISRVQVPDSIPVNNTGKAKVSLRDQGQALLRAFRDEPAFMRITRNTILVSIGLWIASPIYILYFVRSLNASDAWNWRAEHGWQPLEHSRVCDLPLDYPPLGEPNTLKRAVLGLGCYPVLTGIFPSLTLILFAVGLNSIFFCRMELEPAQPALESHARRENARIYGLILHHHQHGGFYFSAGGRYPGKHLRLRPDLDRLRLAFPARRGIFLVFAGDHCP